MAEENNIILSDTERQQYRGWLEAALEAVQGYNGSEAADERLFEPLLAIDAFTLGKNGSVRSDALERRFSKQAWPENPSACKCMNDFLSAAWDSYERKLEEAQDYRAVLPLLAQGGAVIKHSDKTFVPTGEGSIKEATSDNPQPVEWKAQPRLAMLIKHLKEEKIYTDDLIVYTCTPDPGMVRRSPYIVVQIPRIDKEIAVCDEVGEITMVSNKILGEDIWANLNKRQLEARPEITAVRFSNEENWWNNIHSALLGEREPGKKVDIVQYAARKPPLDMDLIKASILEHREMREGWPTRSGEVLHGPYANKETWGGIDTALNLGRRGLPGGSTLAAVKAQVSEEHGLDYKGMHTGGFGTRGSGARGR